MNEILQTPWPSTLPSLRWMSLVPGLIWIALSWLILPRLLAGDAILAAAAHASQRLTGAAT